MSSEVDRRGLEFLVNTEVARSQFDPAVTGLAGGGFVITWTDESLTLGDASSTSTKAQVYDPAGGKVGAEFLVNTFPTGAQREPAITALAGGGFVVTWSDESHTLGDLDGTSIKAQLFTATGAKVGVEFLVNSQAAGGQFEPTVAALANGGFVVTWRDRSNAFGDVGEGITAQVFDAAGVKAGQQFLVNTETANPQVEPSVAGLANGGFVIAWRDRSEALGDLDQGIAAQVFDAAGVKVGQEFLVNTQTANLQVHPTVTGLAGGGFVVAWSDASLTLGDTEGPSIKLQVFTAAGVKVGTEVLVNTQTAGGQDFPAVTALPDGGFAVAWQDSDPVGDGSGFSIKAQVFDADGVKVGSEFLVNSETANNQSRPTIAGVASDGFVVAWEDYSRSLGAPESDIRAQIFSLSPVAGHDITGTQHGDTIVVGVGPMATGDGPDTVHAAAGADTVEGGAGADQLFGAQGRDLMRGGRGDDLMRGGQGGDFLAGGKGDDRIFGDLGPDTLQGDRGSDNLTGGGGPDRFVFTGVMDGGERDLITDFSRQDRIQLLNGMTISSADSSTDADGDGLRDTVLQFSNGGLAVLSNFTLWNGGLFVV